jgi:hypothetical protein
MDPVQAERTEITKKKEAMEKREETNKQTNKQTNFTHTNLNQVRRCHGGLNESWGNGLPKLLADYPRTVGGVVVKEVRLSAIGIGRSVAARCTH